MFVPERKAAGWRRRVGELTKKIDKLFDQMLDADDSMKGVFRRAIEAAEAERSALIEQLDQRDNSLQNKLSAQAISEEEVRAALATLVSSIDGLEEGEAGGNKQALLELIQKVELAEKSDTIRFHLTLPTLSGDVLEKELFEEFRENEARTQKNETPLH
jgi:hypothetical protein